MCKLKQGFGFQVKRFELLCYLLLLLLFCFLKDMKAWILNVRNICSLNECYAFKLKRVKGLYILNGMNVTKIIAMRIGFCDL